MMNTPHTTAQALRLWQVEIFDQVHYVGWVHAPNADDAEQIARDLVAEGGSLSNERGQLTVAHLDRDVQAWPHDQDLISRLYRVVNDDGRPMLDALLIAAGIMRPCDCGAMAQVGATCPDCGRFDPQAPDLASELVPAGDTTHRGGIASRLTPQELEVALVALADIRTGYPDSELDPAAIPVIEKIQGIVQTLP
jgi:hypothetical protein